MMERITEESPRLTARIAGGLYLTFGLAYTFADVSVRGRLIVYGDAAATGHNILALKRLKVTKCLFSNNSLTSAPPSGQGPSQPLFENAENAGCAPQKPVHG